MAHIVPVEDYPLEVYDIDTNESLEMLKAVDITYDCPNRRMEDACVLLFFRSRRGRMVFVHRGSVVGFYYVDELYKFDQASFPNDVFGLLTRQLGFRSKVGFRRDISELAPA